MTELEFWIPWDDSDELWLISKRNFYAAILLLCMLPAYWLGPCGADKNLWVGGLLSSEEVVMNIAGALALAIHDEILDVDLLALHLNESVSTLPAFAGTSGEDMGELGLTLADVTNGVSADVAARYLSNPPFADLARPVPLSEFATSGRAGLPMFGRTEVDEFLAHTAERDPGFVRSWMEFAPIESGADSWVAYPQIASTALEFMLILPVIQDSEHVRLLSVDTGLDVATGTIASAPHIDPGVGCDLGVSGVGWALRQECLRRTCQGECKRKWKLIRGEKRLTGCEC